jgi:hypothetical protein
MKSIEYRLLGFRSAEEAKSKIVSVIDHEHDSGDIAMAKGFKRVLRPAEVQFRDFVNQKILSCNPGSPIFFIWDGEGWVFFGVLP